MNALCDIQKVIPIYQPVIYSLVDIGADTARVDHGSTLLLRLGVQEVVAL
jgi:hypothetical protein